MRTLEKLLIFLNGLLASLLALQRWTAVRRLRLPTLLLAGLQLLLTAVHWRREKARWQMIPTYLLTAVSLPLLGWQMVLHWWGLAALGLATAGGALLPILLPVPRLPRPSGPYTIGTHIFYVTDAQRQEVYSDDPTDKRQLLVQVWYPAQKPKNGRLAPYVPYFDVMLPAIMRRFGLPPFIFTHMKLTRTHSWLDAPILPSERPFPVIAFSHGWMSIGTQSTAMMEELVSQGYVVVSTQHTYGALLTVLPDGRLAPAADPKIHVPDGNILTAGAKLLDYWADDIRTVLRHLDGWHTDPAHRFYGRLQLDQIGIIGHSAGGGAVVQFAATDPRCAAVLALDPWLEPLPLQTADHSFTMPIFIMQSDTTFAQENLPNGHYLLHTVNAPGYYLHIPHSGHYDFSDIPLMTAITRTLNGRGKVKGDAIVQMVNEYTRCFFDYHLLQISPTLFPNGRPQQLPSEFQIYNS